MKKVLIALFALVLIGGGYYWYTNQTMPLRTLGEAIHATYTNGEETVEADFYNESETMVFAHSTLGKIILRRAISASGARYISEDESIVFWEHQGEVTITKDGDEVFKGVTSTDTNEENKPPMQGKLDINTVCDGALAYMTFENGESADKFVTECKAGEHPEVIERYKAEMDVGDGAAI